MAWLHAGRVAAALAAVAVAAFGPGGPAAYARTQLLRGSLSIVLYYLAQALVLALLAVGRPQKEGAPPDALGLLRMASGTIVFGEAPLLLAIAYAGLQVVPASWASVYGASILALQPLGIVAEGLAAVTLILSAGQLWGPYLSRSHLAVQMAALLVCLALFGYSGSVLVRLLTSGALSTAASAGHAAAAAVTLAVCIGGTLVASHGSVLDAALLTVYLTYNVWSACGASAGGWGAIGRAALSVRMRLLPALLADDALSAAASALSPQLLATLIVQMAVFVAVLRMARAASDGGPATHLSFAAACALPALGRALVVAYYTQAWLRLSPLRAPGAEALLVRATAAAPWRWANVYFCAALYVRHLVFPPDE